jgi:hypothetical protein
MQVFTLHREPEHVAYSTFKKRSNWDFNLLAQRRTSAKGWNQVFGQVRHGRVDDIGWRKQQFFSSEKGLLDTWRSNLYFLIEWGEVTHPDTIDPTRLRS